MRLPSSGLIGVLGLACLLVVGGQASAQMSSEKQLRRDRLKLALDAGGVVGGFFVAAVTLNPTIMVMSSGSMGVHAYQYRKHKAQAEDEATGTTNAVPQQVESLMAVPGRPGYFFYPSNPNQLYYSATSASASDPMSAKLPESTKINVRIANTAKDGRTIHYMIAGTPFSVPPGYTQVLAMPENSVIVYDRGAEAGLEQFTLVDGDYEFRSADQGWRFYTTSQPKTAVAKAADPSNPTRPSKPGVIVR